ncbi:uncharacterized protein KRP23_4845 [Phytophthora ramorum]|uniref:uncharacterized protein n=1 Tax=Phytophthora ramorum TaxID=164328 RepID=UPI0030A06DD8|nr:hypothetical protein KRP23_4845 [Phytophthora ramorum]
MAELPPPRLSGTIWKRNAGILRAWHSRAAVVTAEGFLRYREGEWGQDQGDGPGQGNFRSYNRSGQRVLLLRAAVRTHPTARPTGTGACDGGPDWFSEWNFCLRSLKNDREPFAARQRRLRLHTIWMQFELFAEILAEISSRRSSSEMREALLALSRLKELPATML